jgi:hypothetical protein
MTPIMKTIKPWRKKIKKILKDEKTSHVYESVDLILWKWLNYQKGQGMREKDGGGEPNQGTL